MHESAVVPLIPIEIVALIEFLVILCAALLVVFVFVRLLCCTVFDGARGGCRGGWGHFGFWWFGGWFLLPSFRIEYRLFGFDVQNFFIML